MKFIVIFFFIFSLNAQSHGTVGSIDDVDDYERYIVFPNTTSHTNIQKTLKVIGSI